MTKLDDKVNEILGIEADKPTLESIIKVENPPVPRIQDKNKADIDSDLRKNLENEFKYMATELSNILFPFLPFLSVEVKQQLNII